MPLQESLEPTQAAHWLRDEVVPQALQETGFLLEHWQWVGLVLLVIAAVIGDRIARVVTARIVGRWLPDVTGDGAPGAAAGPLASLASFERPVGLWVAALLLRASLPLLDLADQPASVLALAFDFVIAVAGVWAAYRLVDVVGDAIERRAQQTANRFDDMLVPLLRRSLKVVVVLVGLLYLASKWTDDLWSVVAGLGIGSVAVAFAARDSIENLFGTFTVLLDKPFSIGDWITMGDLDGSVESVGFRSTRVRTFYDSVITVPNRHFISGQVDNMGARHYRRIKTMLSLTYDTPPEKVEAFCEGLRELVREHPRTRKDSFHVYLNAFGPSSLDVLLYCFVRTPDWSTELAEKHRLYCDALRLAERLGVSFAFPTTTVHLAKPEDGEHPDRPAGIEAGRAAGRDAAQAILEETGVLPGA